MKRFAIALLLLAGLAAHAQLSYTVPQSETNNGTAIFSAVTTAQTSTCLRNEGQNIWISNYTIGQVSPPSNIQYRLEFSYNSAAPACTTGTWFPMSDDATDTNQAEVIGIGSYPFVRANLVKCGGCGSNGAFTSFYTTTSAMPGVPFGFYGGAQAIRKVIFNAVSTDSTVRSTPIITPYGSSAGFLFVFTPTGTFPGSSSISVLGTDNANSCTGAFDFGNGTGGDFSLPSTGGVLIPFPATGTTSICVSYSPGGANGSTFSAWYYFYPPGTAQPYGAQPATTVNTESTATHAIVTTNVPFSGSGVPAQRGHLFSIDARCSAGTATVTVKDGTTQIYSSSSGGVGTTNFTKAWNPALASTSGNRLVIALSDCGVGNIGTLDVQASVF